MNLMPSNPPFSLLCQDMLNIEDYYITYNNSRDNAGMEVLCDDETLKDALQNLGENERLEIKLCPKQLHNQPSAAHRYHSSSAQRYSPRKFHALVNLIIL